MLINRRDSLLHAGSVALGAAAVPHLSPRLLAAEPEPRWLRVIAYNVYGCTGWPRDRVQRAAQEQMPARLARELAKHRPDIVNFSESPDESVVKDIAQRLGMNYVFFPSAGNWPGALLSRYAIVAPQNVPLAQGKRPTELFTRHWGRATIQVPDAGPLIVHSAHLHPSASPKTRLREIPLMLKAMRDDLQAQRSQLLIGDLNHNPGVAEYKLWIEAGWTDTFSKAANAGKGEGLTIKADNPQHRIDYVMSAGWMVNKVIVSKPLFEGAFRLDNTDPQAFALSDHLPQFAMFEYDVPKDG